MWANDRQRNEVSLLGLVASDFAYQKRADILFDPRDPTRGEYLSSLPDSQPGEEYSFPDAVLGTSSDSAVANFSTWSDQNGVGVVSFPNWQVFDVIENNGTGFGAVIFRGVYASEGRQRTDFIVAFRGTDGRDGKDWYSNIQLGQNQWAGSASAISAALQDLQNADGSVFSGQIHFTGQSLGGALAQYAAYEFALGNAFNPSRVTLTTFNSFATGAGLLDAYGTDPNNGFKAERLSGVSTAHYTIQNDIVHNFGAAVPQGLGHLNANDGNVSNLYHFGDFRAFANEQPKPGEQNFLGLVEGHRIETGFYAGLARYNTSFAGISAGHSIEYADVGELQQMGEIFARALGGDRTNTVSAWARVAVGTLIAGLIGNPKQFQAVLDVLADSLYNSEDIGGFTKGFIKSGIPNLLLKVLALPVLKVAGAGLFIASLADLMDERASVDGAVSYANSFLPSASSATVISQKTQEPYSPQASATRFEIALAVANPDAIEEIHLQAIAPKLKSLELDLNEFGATLYGGGDWLRNSLHALVEKAKEKGITNAELALFDANLAAFTNSTILAAGDGDQIYLQSVKEQLHAFVREDLGWAVANANTDFKDPYQLASNAFSGTVTDFQDYSKIQLALEAALQDPRFVSVHELIAEALDISEAAWQTPVISIRSDYAANPFDDENFEPDTAAIPTAGLAEGSITDFSMYLPYEAGEGGQQVKVAVTGPTADELSVVLDDGEIELDTDGVFTLMIYEGQREASFSLRAGKDIDGSGTLTLTATLINAEGEETHEPDEEATVTLTTNDESTPAGGMELHGDWGLKDYPVFYDDGMPVVDENGQQVYDTRFDTRYPDVFNLERDPNGRPDFGEQIDPLIGLDAADHIWLGQFGGAGLAYGMGGDDYLEGMANVPNLIFGDDALNFMGRTGNDTIEGGENLAPHVEGGFTIQGEHIDGIGDDVIFGGSGDDQLYADRLALLDETLDEDTVPLDQKGDWINGESGDDLIFGSAAHDALFGGGGADVIRGGAGNDVIDGDDNYYNWRTAWWEIDGGPYGVTFFPVTNLAEEFYPFEYYRDFGGDDVLDGGAGDDLLFGMLGEDTLIGGSGKDQLDGWEGDDRLFGGDGDDVLAGDFGRDERTSRRAPGADLRVMPGASGLFSANPANVEQTGNDYLDGGAGDDALLGEAGDDTLLGGEGADRLLGDADYLEVALHGADILDGGAGDDLLAGYAGDDRMYGGPDDDSIYGAEGNDAAEGGTGNDMVFGGEGDDLLKGGDGTDTLAGEAGVDVLYGGKGDDDLDGGEDDDTLYGEAGSDKLAGGVGDDRLFGGAAEDVLSGGDGDDIIDGGAGIDIAQGGTGDDTYFMSLGYGRDRIEDTEGLSRIQFGFGITPDDLKATLDAGSLAATVDFGFADDSVTFSMSQSQFSGADFADGTRWTSKQLFQLVPALKTQGSSAGEAISANPFVRNELQGFEGDDSLTGSENDDRLEGGAGADMLDGDAGSDEYVFFADETGTDHLSDSGIGARAYLEWFYANQGSTDWVERGQFGGRYKAVVAGDGEEFIGYYDSPEEAYAEMPDASTFFIEPLESFAPLVRRDDGSAIEELVAADVLSRDVVDFADGLSLTDLTLTVTVNQVDAVENPDRPWHGGGMLSVRWADGGFDVEVPDVNYGFVGENLLTDGSDPELDVPGAWRGYRLGEGIEAFRFADGTSYAMEELLEGATVVQVAADYAFARGSGTQVISRGYGSIVFDADIHSEEVAVSRYGTDLLITLGDGSAQGRVVGWYDDPGSQPSISLLFASDPEIDATTLTKMGLHVAGTEGDDAIMGLDGFDDIIAGVAGNDILDGGSGKDTYVFHRGDGIDTITDSPTGAEDASEVVLADIFSWEASFGLGSLVINFDNADAIHFTAFDSDDPYSTPVFDRLEFADGRSIAYEEVLANGFLLQGGDEDDSLSGTGLGDSIDGGAGNDVLSGRGGTDFVEGGVGDDTLAGGSGDFDFMSGSAGSDTYVYAAGDGNDSLLDWSDVQGEIDTVQLIGIEPATARVTQDPSLYYLVFGDGDQLSIDTMPTDPSAAIERIEFDDGTVWLPEDVVARVELLPPTERDDTLWGTDADDALYGLDGSDSLYGNAGNDLLVGGEGEDFYYFAAGHGHDVVDNSDSDGLPDSLHFADAASTDLVLGRAGNDLVLRSGADSVTLAGWYGESSGSNYEVSFELNGDFWDDAMLLELAPVGGNESPELANPIEDQTADEDSEYSFTVAPDAFSDAEGAETLTYAASLVNGSPLPEWLVFDANTRTFSGTPLQADVGSIEVRVTAQDPEGLSTSADFALTISSTNDTPVLSSGIDDQGATEDLPFTFTAADETFSDEDPEDVLEWFASRPDGSALPDWLAFDAATRTFSGTPSNDEVGALEVQLSATDIAGFEASDTFTIEVANENDAPTVANPVGERSFEAGSPFSFAVPANTFADEDTGDSLRVSAGLYGGGALPAWLNFDAASESFSGNPGKEENGISRVVLTATDAAGALVATDFGLIIHAKAGSAATGSKADDALFGGNGSEVLIAKGGNDALFGGGGGDLLHGGRGQDVLQGGEGTDILHGGSGQNLLDGGAGADLIFGGRGSSLIAGGSGNDLIHAGSGRDVLLFNRGDGMDSVYAERSGDNTLSFGGGIRYSDLSLSRTGKDLVVNAGGNDRVVLKGWYGGKRSVANLQFVLESDYDAGSSDGLYNRKVQSFDFLGMVSAFDSAREASPGLTSWDVTNALLQFHLSGADDAALGGDLAYAYAKNRGFGGISVAAAQQVIGASGFGSDAQSLRPFGGLHEGFVKLT